MFFADAVGLTLVWTHQGFGLGVCGGGACVRVLPRSPRVLELSRVLRECRKAPLIYFLYFLAGWDARILAVWSEVAAPV